MKKRSLTTTKVVRYLFALMLCLTIVGQVSNSFCQTPAVPANFKVVLGARGVDAIVSWDATPNADNYEVYLSTDVKVCNTTKLTITETDLTPNIARGYKVRACIGSNRSSFTTVINVTPYLPAPTGFAAKAITPEIIDFSWNRLNTAFGGYAILNCSDSRLLANITRSTDTTYRMSGLVANTNYSFKLVGYSNGMGRPSTCINIKTPGPYVDLIKPQTGTFSVSDIVAIEVKSEFINSYPKLTYEYVDKLGTSKIYNLGIVAIGNGTLSWKIPNELAGSQGYIVVRDTEFSLYDASASKIIIKEVPSFYQLSSSNILISVNPLQNGQSAEIMARIKNTGNKNFTDTLYLSWHNSSGTLITDLAKIYGLNAGDSCLLKRASAPIISKQGTYKVISKYYDSSTKTYVNLVENSVDVQELSVSGTNITTAIIGQDFSFDMKLTSALKQQVGMLASFFVTAPDGTTQYVSLPMASRINIGNGEEATFKTTYKFDKLGTYKLQYIGWYDWSTGKKAGTSDPIYSAKGQIMTAVVKEAPVYEVKLLFPLNQSLNPSLSYTFSWEGTDIISLSTLSIQRLMNGEWVPFYKKENIAGTFMGVSTSIRLADIVNSIAISKGKYRWKVTATFFGSSVSSAYSEFYVSQNADGFPYAIDGLNYFKEAGEHYQVAPNVIRAIAWEHSECLPANIKSLVGWRYGITGLPLHTTADKTIYDPWWLAGILISGSSSFSGFSDYKDTKVDELAQILLGKDVTGFNSLAFNYEFTKANIRATAFLLRYYANMYPELMGVDGNKNYSKNFPWQALESWWIVVTRYGADMPGGAKPSDDMKKFIKSNYPFRVYDCLMKGFMGYQIPITLPPHVLFEVADNSNLYNQTKSSDYLLIPHTPNEVQFVRVTVPFLPWRDLRYLHLENGRIMTDSEIGITYTDKQTPEFQEEFELKFILAGKSAYNTQINARFDYSNPNVNEINDGFMIDNQGIVNEKKYDHHAAHDYQARDNINDNNKYNWLLQYPDFTGSIRITSSVDITNTHIITHGNGYRTWYTHPDCTNPYFVTNNEINLEHMDKYLVRTGNQGAGKPHAHIQIERYIGYNSNDWNNQGIGDDKKNWIPVDPYGWQGVESSHGGEVVDELWTRAKYSKLWASGNRIVPDPTDPMDGCAQANSIPQKNDDPIPACPDPSTLKCTVSTSFVNNTQVTYNTTLRAILVPKTTKKSSNSDPIVIGKVDFVADIGDTLNFDFPYNMDTIAPGIYTLEFEFWNGTSWQGVDDAGFTNPVIIDNRATSITDNAIEEKPFIIYPNPFTNEISILSPSEDALLYVHSSSGQLLYNNKILNKKTLSTQDWSPGIYYFSIKTKSQSFSFKLIKN